MFGSSEILIVAIVVLVLFGATALPKFFRSLGKAKSEFQKGVSEADSSSVSESSSASEGTSHPDQSPDGNSRKGEA